MENKRHISARLQQPQRLGLEAAAVVSGSFLAGAMMSLSAFTIPVFLDTNSDAAHMLRQWSRLYHYGHIYLPGLSVTTCGLYVSAAIGAKNRSGSQRGQSPSPQNYLLAAATTLCMVPFTWLVMAPTNNVLFGLEGSRNGTADLGPARDLLARMLTVSMQSNASVDLNKTMCIVSYLMVM
ncbi:DUF1772-domain-containing protein [Diaporthe amygdali]|uniref:DUF1772-domain-containing protein n=1 Tax=Phomopsis amygdali TaxID=1214568 RepID=UPI0022FF22EE|nr:DUF1772-domain-containing protein [Diaporthe amygdali]KAJ0107616.1 DUF1772-domain-containing protein [Diaporthe amygdali]